MKTRFEFHSEKLTVRIDEEMLHLGFGENRPNVKVALSDMITVIRCLTGIISKESTKN